MPISISYCKALTKSRARSWIESSGSWLSWKSIIKYLGEIIIHWTLHITKFEIICLIELHETTTNSQDGNPACYAEITSQYHWQLCNLTSIFITIGLMHKIPKCFVRPMSQFFCHLECQIKIRRKLYWYAFQILCKFHNISVPNSRKLVKIKQDSV